MTLQEKAKQRLLEEFEEEKLRRMKDLILTKSNMEVNLQTLIKQIEDLENLKQEDAHKLHHATGIGGTYAIR